MNDSQLLRYSRHILLDEFGVEAQQKLLESEVLIVGAGGLGCPAALYLAASGVGRITLADADTVDATNLQRQILYREADVGTRKVEASRAALALVNPEVKVVALPERLNAATMARLVSTADAVLDCSDNFATRHALNRACVQYRKPLVSGAAIRFDGQLAVFDPRREDSPCYACLFPEEGGAEELACAVMGVLSPLTGVIGAMQAAETLKLLTGMGTTLAGRLSMYDALHGDWRTVRVPRDPQCSTCGRH